LSAVEHGFSQAFGNALPLGILIFGSAFVRGAAFVPGQPTPSSTPIRLYSGRLGGIFSLHAVTRLVNPGQRIQCPEVPFCGRLAIVFDCPGEVFLGFAGLIDVAQHVEGKCMTIAPRLSYHPMASGLCWLRKSSPISNWDFATNFPSSEAVASTPDGAGWLLFRGSHPRRPALQWIWIRASGPVRVECRAPDKALLFVRMADDDEVLLGLGRYGESLLAFSALATGPGADATSAARTNAMLGEATMWIWVAVHGFDGRNLTTRPQPSS